MKYLRKQDVVARAVAGTNLLVPVHGCTSTVYTLNHAGNRLWDLIALPRREDELAAALVEQYRIPSETAGRDVRAFLDDMLRMGLAQEQE
jgi:hypothetical protein